MTTVNSAKAVILGCFCFVAAVLPVTATASTGDAAVPWTAFSESNGCEDPFTGTPLASKIGGLSSSEPILGPFGTYFGRTPGAISADLVWWIVPNSGGKQVKVHERALPAFQAVAAGLAEAATQGLNYTIKPNGSFVPRTVGGFHRMSRHTFGTTIDINTAQNPFRGDGVLVTDMPEWFVQIWKDAGFCWGGDWIDVKDPMHFSWIGPKAGNLNLPYLTAYPPTSNTTDFADRSVTAQTVFSGEVRDGRTFSVADLSGYGSPAAVALRATPQGTIIESVSATDGWQGCSVDRWATPQPTAHEATLSTFVDVDSDSRPDLVVGNWTGSSVALTVAVRVTKFEEVSSFSTPLGFEPVHMAGADSNGDRIGDLWFMGAGGELAVALGPDFTTVSTLPNLPSSGISFAVGDIGPDGDIDVVVNTGAQLVIYEDNGGWSLSETLPSVSDGDHAVIDYDGDGRADIVEIDSTGRLVAHFGNSDLGFSPERWMFNPDFDCDEPPVLLFNGTFHDDDSSIFEKNIEAIVDLGVTFGCNPPFNDQYCPLASVTRGQMAAFLDRALDLPNGEIDLFTDDDGSVFEAVIDRVGSAGITRGCNPPENNNFCPDQHVTRGQMAAFLVRALSLPASEVDFFSDDEGSTFEKDINALAAAGITTGCAEDSFCPQSPVTRGQMAAFLDRAFG